MKVTFSGLREWQREALQAFKRFTVIVAARRSGKTVLAILWLLRQVAGKKDARGVYFAPQRDQAKRIAWGYIHKYCGAIPGTEFNESELKVSFPSGAAIWLLGADRNPDAIRGIGLHAAVLDEVAQFGPMVWTHVIRPALSDAKGHALFIGTPFGRANQFHDFYQQGGKLPDWASMVYPWDKAKAIDPDEIEALKREQGEDAFAQEYECSFDAAVKGAFYGREMAEAERAGRIGQIPWEKALPVHTSWDLGSSQASPTLWVWCWQVSGPQKRALRAMGFQAASLPDVVSELQKLPYIWGTDYLPHDVTVKDLSADRSRLQILEDLGRRVVVVPQHSVADGIEAVRAAIPSIWFDREGCFEGIEALKTYRSEWDDTHRVFKKNPLHSWESHPADAVRTFFMGDQGRKPSRQKLDYRAMDRAVI